MKLIKSFSFLILFLVTVACSGEEVQPQQQEVIPPTPKYVIKIDSVNAPSLKSSVVANDTVQHIRVFVPPYYSSYPEQRYPVVYMVHGYDDSYRNDYGIFKMAYDEMLAERIKPFILVTVNSDCPIGGTFGVNSPITGNWEDHITDEIIDFVDTHYRTLQKRESRGIAGFSMGGFVALNLGLKHSDLYNLVYAICPGVMVEGDLKGAYALWRSDGTFIDAYGASFAYDQTLPYPHVQKPLFNNTTADNLVIGRWLSGFGYFDKKLDSYLLGSTRLKSIALDWGTADYYGWIPRGCVYLADLLEQKGINHQVFIRTNGYHEVTQNSVKSYMLPYFSENLAFE